MSAKSNPIVLSMLLLAASAAAASAAEEVRPEPARESAPLVRLRGFAADPGRSELRPALAPEELLAAGKRFVPEGARAAGGPGEDYWIVQFEDRAPAFRESLVDCGVEVLSFVPDSAWLVRARPDRIAVVRKLPGTRWAGAYRAVHAVSANLLECLGREGGIDSMEKDERGWIGLDVAFQPGTDVEAHVAYLARLEGVRVDSSSVTGLFAALAVEPPQLRRAIVAAALLRDVEAIVSRPPSHPMNDQAVWGLQSGIDLPGAADYAISASLFARGIAGQGMVVALADSGLANELCQFRYGPEIDEACWPVGPPPEQPVPEERGGLFGLVEPPLRTRERKVIAYYLIEGASAYVDEGQHGSQVAGCILGDDYGVLAGRPLVRDRGLGQNLRSDRPDGEWSPGESLRPELAARVDDPTVAEPAFPPDFGGIVQHHQGRDGVAPAAQLVLQDIADDEGRLVGRYTPIELLSQAHESGATVFNVSFGGQPCDPATCYGAKAWAADLASWKWRDLVVVASAGNRADQGSATIDEGFAQGRSVLAVGATERSDSPSEAPAVRPGEDLEPFSSRGPRAGGLLAPILVTPGHVLTVAAASVAPEDGSGSGGGGCGSLEPALANKFGTSFSAGTLSGLSLLVQQYFLDGWYPSGAPVTADAFRPTNALTRAVLVNSARNLAGARTGDRPGERGDRPNGGQGWGSPRLDDTLYFAGDPPIGLDPRGDTQRARLIVLTDTPNGHDERPGTRLSAEPGGRRRSEIVASYRPAIRDGEIHEFFLDVARADFDGDGNDDDPANELRLSLAWSDLPGMLGGSPVTNDLDLEVTSPSCLVYRPAPEVDWSGGSLHGRPGVSPQELPFRDFLGRDALNSIENVFVAPAEVEPGTWTVRVIGYAVPGGRVELGRPNFVDGEGLPLLRDLDGDTVPDSEIEDRLDGALQGYALVASGHFAAVDACVPLSCESIEVTQESDCGPVGLELTSDACSRPMSVDWDIDGDGSGDASGNPVTLDLPPGRWTITALATDSCEPPGSCSLDVEVFVEPSELQEVSDVRAGAPPLLVSLWGSRVTVESAPSAEAYNAYSDAIGSWFAPAIGDGTRCALDSWTDHGDGTLSFDLELAANTWIDVTASNACAEGPPGRNSFLEQRDGFGDWEHCGPSP